MRTTLALLAVLGASLPARADPQPFGNPAVNQPLKGCVVGRAVRIMVDGTPGCSVGTPTLTSCTGGTLSLTSTDYTGTVTIPAGLTACTVVMSALYTSPQLGCLAQSQGGGLITTSPTMGATATNSTMTIPLSLALTATKVFYICSPG